MQSRRLLSLFFALFLTSCTLSAVPTPTPTSDVRTSITLTISPTHTAAPTTTFTPIPTVTRKPTRTPTITHTPRPSLTPTPTFAPLTMMLPHNLYFLGPGSIQTDSGARPKQIWRLATNGVTLTEITHEDYDVEEFDISPVTGRVAYVTDQLHHNQLILIRPDGSGRQVIVDDGPTDEWDLNWVDALRWSPNGQILAYHHDGIVFYQVQTGQVVRVFADHPDKYQRYSPELWAPDGKRLLVIEGGYEGGWWMLYNLEEKTWIRLDGPHANGTASWSPDSRLAVFTSSYLMGGDCEELLQFDVFAQIGTTLIPCQASRESFSNSDWPLLTPSNDLLYFYNYAESYGTEYGNVPWTIMRAKLGEGNAPVLLRSSIPVGVSEVLWADDGKIAIVSFSDGPDGPIALVPVEKSQPLQLLASQGKNLRWGP